MDLARTQQLINVTQAPIQCDFYQRFFLGFARNRSKVQPKSVRDFAMQLNYVTRTDCWHGSLEVRNHNEYYVSWIMAMLNQNRPPSTSCHITLSYQRDCVIKTKHISKSTAIVCVATHGKADVHRFCHVPSSGDRIRWNASIFHFIFLATAASAMPIRASIHDERRERHTLTHPT